MAFECSLGRVNLTPPSVLVQTETVEEPLDEDEAEAEKDEDAAEAEAEVEEEEEQDKPKTKKVKHRDPSSPYPGEKPAMQPGIHLVFLSFSL